ARPGPGGPRRGRAGTGAKALAGGGRSAGGWPADPGGGGLRLPRPAPVAVGVGTLRPARPRRAPLSGDKHQHRPGTVATGGAALVVQPVTGRGGRGDRLPGAASPAGGRGRALTARGARGGQPGGEQSRINRWRAWGTGNDARRKAEREGRPAPARKTSPQKPS